VLVARDVKQSQSDARDTAAYFRRCGFYLMLVPALFLLVVESGNITSRFFVSQDAPALLFGGLGLLLLSYVARPLGRGFNMQPRLVAVLLAASTFLFAFAGWWLVFDGYSFSRDELLADFDADVLRRGFLIGPIPAAWQAFAPAMMAIHMLEIPPEAGWLSGYLPVNALFRAGMETVADRSLTSPLLAGLAVLALFGVARRLWPERPSLSILAILLLAFSPQFLVTAMTPFAMTGHLALNLIWLWLYLRDRRVSDVGAILVGALATGLHQIVFHPLFVLPFIAELLIARRWGRAALFILAYLIIGLSWASYWKIALAVSGIPAPVGAADSPVLLHRAIMVLKENDLIAIPVMMMNLLRFVAWLHLLLLPLLILAWPSIRNAEGIARPLAAGMAALIMLVLILLPWQGVGWGYRYLHGLLGNACLLACYGWMRMDRGMTRERRRTVLAGTSALTLFVILPFHLYQTREIVRPHREASAFLEASGADLIVIDMPDVEMGDELVRNRPDLSNRPLMIDLRTLTPEQAETLCERRRFHLFDKRHARALGLNPVRLKKPATHRFHDLGCGVPLPLPPELRKQA
jgi:hypothetical protein